MKQQTRYGVSTFHPTRLAALAVVFAATGCASLPPSDPEQVAGTGISTVRIATASGSSRPDFMVQDIIAEESTIALSAATVWGVLGGVYEQLDIPVTTTDPATMTVGNAGYVARRIGGTRMNAFLDCGMNPGGPLANQYEVTIAVMSRLKKVEEDRTELSTVVNGSAKPRATSGYPVACTTRQELEELIMKKVMEALGLGD